ncbi:hypothetical protein HDZ31DRAFT_70372 [Schizophyllum fasciatum]
MEKNKGVLNFAGPSSQAPTQQEEGSGEMPAAFTSSGTSGKRKASGSAAAEKETKTRRVEGRLRADTVTLPPRPPTAGPSTITRRRSPSRPQSPALGRPLPPRSIMDLIHHSPPSLPPPLPEPPQTTRSRSSSLPLDVARFPPTDQSNFDVSTPHYNLRAWPPHAEVPPAAPDPPPPDGPMLRYAWEDIHTRDCLQESDDALDNDEAQQEYSRRLDVVSRLPFMEPSARPQWEPDTPLRPSPHYLFSSRPPERS